MRDGPATYQPFRDLRTHLLQLHNMHGPTVYWSDSLDDLPALLTQKARLDNSNAGTYRLIVTIDGRAFEMTEVNQ